MDFGTFNFLTGDPGQIVSALLRWFLTILGILAVIYFIYGGSLYLTAGSDPEKATKGRTVIINAIIGIIIIVASFVIVQLVSNALATAPHA
jgi:quinol-cytochrome oxidoreductase complex cytochrome b subunit